MNRAGFDVLPRIVGIDHSVSAGGVRHELHEAHGTFVRAGKAIESGLDGDHRFDQRRIESCDARRSQD